MNGNSASGGMGPTLNYSQVNHNFNNMNVSATNPFTRLTSVFLRAQSIPKAISEDRSC